MKTALMRITQRPEQIFTHGDGSYLYDADGNRYLDFMQGWAVNTLGHSHPAIVEAINRQAMQLINPGPAFYNAPAIELAQKLTDHCALDQVFFANSGAEANEGAIKLARKWGQLHRNGAWKIITFQNGFHGRTLATMSATGKAAFEPLFNPKVPGFNKVPYGDLAAVKAAIDSETVAIMLEPIQGEAGVIPAGSEFLQELRALADQQGILLILDEVQTGMGRTGSIFCHQHHGVEPDIMTLGKGLGGGVPISALLAKQKVCCFEPGDQGGTFNGNPVMCAAALAVMDELLKPGFMAQVRSSAARLTSGLEALSTLHALGDVRGEGLLLAMQTGTLDAVAISKACHEQGMLINAPRPDTLRFMPALTVTEDCINTALATLSSVLDQYQPATR